MTSTFAIPVLVLIMVLVPICYIDSGLPGAAWFAVLIGTHTQAALALAIALFFGLLGYADGGLFPAIKWFVVTLIITTLYLVMEAIFGRSGRSWGGCDSDVDGDDDWDFD